MTGRRGWRRLLRPATFVALALVAWAILAVTAVLWARNDAVRGIDAVAEAQRHASPPELVAGRPAPALARCAERFASSHRLLTSLTLRPLDLLPVVGRQLRSARILTTGAAHVCRIGRTSLRAAQTAFAAPHDTGAGRVGLVNRLEAIAHDTVRRLEAVDLGPQRALVRPLAVKRATMREKLGRLQAGLRRGEAAAHALGTILTGPKRYLLVAANNSEMRAGSGMFLSAGEVAFRDGDLSLGDFRPTGDLHVPPAAAPAIEDPDLAARWGALNPNQEWRNLALSPRFDASAPLAAKMWVAVGGAPVDGVLMVDPVVLQAVVAASGPIDVGGRALEAHNVADFVLHDQYAGFGATNAELGARRDLLGAIAKAAFGNLTAARLDVAALASGVAQAARGRHLLAWAARPEDEAAWDAAGVSGRLGYPSLAVAVLNRGGNKLDRFLNVRSALSLRPADDGTDAVLRVEAANVTPDGQSPYVLGVPAGGGAPGDYSGLLSVNVPGTAAAVSVDGTTQFTAAGPDGPTKVVAVPLDVPRGRTVTVTIRFRLPRHDLLYVEPSARVPAMSWTAGRLSWRSDDRRAVTW